MTLQTIDLENENGMRVCITNYGARIASILYPVNGTLTEMTVVPKQAEGLLSDDFYLGATCGPVCNRIAGAGFSLDDKRYQLSKNDGENCLHGGANNVSYRFWEILEKSQNQVSMKLELGHLVDGFPGNRELFVTYRLNQDNGLEITFEAESNLATPVNMTNHAYFNLGENNIDQLRCRLNADHFLARTSDGIPTGELVPCSELGVNLKEWQAVKEVTWNSQYEQIQQEQGVDHCFVLNKREVNEPAAELISEKNMVKLSVFTDEKAIQFYTGKFLGEPHVPYEGLCFESQGYTDAINQPRFPSVTLDQDARYKHNILYQFASI